MIVEDVHEIFTDVCAHRILLSQKARMEKRTAVDVTAELLRTVKVPHGL